MGQPATRKVEKTAQSTRNQTPTPRKDSNRDLAEQIVIALILAFLIRGFEAEAFVIPTGSMAPTLVGQHKEVYCPECGNLYRVNASEEVENPSPATRVIAGVCGNCRFPARLDQEPTLQRGPHPGQQVRVQPAFPARG